MEVRNCIQKILKKRKIINRNFLWILAYAAPTITKTQILAYIYKILFPIKYTRDFTF